MTRYSEYKPINLPWLDSIPSHWDRSRNKVVLKESKETVGENSSDYTLLSLTKGGVIVRDLSQMKGKFPSDFGTYKTVSNGQIIFCLFDVDETPRTVGLSQHKGMITGAYDVFSITGVNPRFIEYYYLALDDVKAMRPLYTGLRKVIGINTFMQTHFPLPPRDEQDQIVRYLDWKVSAINKLLNKKRKQVDLLRNMEQTIINNMFINLTNDWESKPLKYWVKSNIRSLNADTPDDYVFDYLDISSVGHGYIKQKPERYIFSNAPSRARRIVQYGDTIISTVRTYLRSVCFIDSDYEKCIVSTGFSVLTPDTNTVLPELLSYALSTDIFIDEVIKNSIGVSYPAINDSNLLRLKVSLPKSLIEQERLYFALKRKLSSCKHSIENIEHEITLLTEYRTRLISDVVTGKLDVRGVIIPEYETIEDTPDSSDTDDTEETEDLE